VNAAILLAIAIALAALSGPLGLAFDRGSPASARVPVFALLASAALGIASAGLALAGPPCEVSIAWAVPGGALAVRIDALAAMFLLQLFVIGGLGAVYGLAYWSDADHPRDARRVRVFYGLVVAGIAIVIAARNAVLFLAGWEIMALAAFFLVSTEDTLPAVRRAGLVYLLATRLATLCLFAMFALLRSVNGSFDLHAPAIDAARPIATAMLLLALVGFGLKAGAMPLHVWLPGAHANAPSHVSALMSGMLIKTGIYALLRFVSFFPTPPAWWGGLVLGLGLASGVLGVAFAIGQHDLKRLLAYHSVENIGIILIGLGVALLGRAAGDPVIFALGLGGALLHVWNHGLFKALLFLAAGSVVHATGTREIDALGGLQKRMPKTAAGFLLGAVAICGLPPLNGFVSELLVYLALLRACTSARGSLFLAGALGAPLLALVGALAVACFVKAYGAVFLGERRTDHGARAHEAPPAMLLPMGVLGALCVFIGLAPRLVAPVLDRAIAAFGGAPGMSAAPAIASLAPLALLTPIGLGLIAAVAIGARLLAGVTRAAPRAPTWDCGYAAPTARMQYTSSSFAETLVGLFAGVLRPERHAPHLEGPFPRPAAFHSHVPEVVLDRGVTPAFRLIGRALSAFRWLQGGTVHVYVLYILFALLFSLLVYR
jgi:hydrogenase-4 component B